jgi:hypothetical protein
MELGRIDQKANLSPRRFSRNVLLRRASVFVIMLGVAAAVFGMAAKVPGDTTVKQLLDNPTAIITLTFASLVYSAYLALVVNHSLLHRDICNMSAFSSAMPFFLLAAYVSMPVEFWFFKRSVGISTFAFFIVYMVWFINGLYKLKKGNSGDTTRSAHTDHFTWLFVDAVAAIALTVELIGILSHYSTSSSNILQDRSAPAWAGLGVGLTLKDAAVALSLISCIVHTKVASRARGEPFPDAMIKYVGALRRDRDADAHLTEFKSWISHNVISKSINVLDFGCGDSKRSIEVLSELGLQPSQIHLFRYDAIHSWAEYGPTTRSPRGHQSVAFDSNIASAEKWASSADLIVASHSLYSPKAVMDLCRLVQTSPPGCVVVARGGSPRSYLATLVVYRLFSWLRPFYAAVWDVHGLSHIESQCKLRRVGISGSPLQPAILGQTLVVQEDTLGAMEQAMQFSYGKRMALAVRSVCEMALNNVQPDQNGVRSISFESHDFVYLLQKPSPARVEDGVPDADRVELNSLQPSPEDRPTVSAKQIET